MFCREIKIRDQNLNLILYERFSYLISPSRAPIINPHVRIPNSITRTPSPAIETKVSGEIMPCKRLNKTNTTEITNKTFSTLFE